MSEINNTSNVATHNEPSVNNLQKKKRGRPALPEDERIRRLKERQIQRRVKPEDRQKCGRKKTLSDEEIRERKKQSNHRYYYKIRDMLKMTP